MKRLYVLLMFTICTLLIYSQSISSSAIKDSIGIDFFAKVKSISNLQEKDGNIFFLLRQPDLEQDKYITDLYQLVGGEAVRLTSSQSVSDYFLQGNAIYFKDARSQSQKNKPETVYYKLTKEYGEATEWVRLPYAVRDIQAIDENRFFFTASDQLVEKANTDKAIRIFDELPFWSNGQGDISGKRVHLYYYNSGDITLLSDSLETVSDIELSPDKKHLAYIQKKYQTKATQHNTLVTLDVSTLQHKEWNLFDRGIYSQVQFIDDKQVFVLINRSLEHNKMENSGFYSLDILSGNVKELYDGDLYAAGNSIGSDVKSGGKNKLTFDKSGFTYISTIVDQAPLIHLDYNTSKLSYRSPSDISISDYVPYSGGYLLIAMADQLGDEIYSVNAKGDITRLSDINTVAFENKAIAKPIEVKFRNELGKELNGYVLPPVNFKEGVKYPTILDIHGGPRATYGTVFFHEMQYWANKGYAVIYTNPTGSNGRGSEFTDLRGKFGTVDYNDILSFVDAAIQQTSFIDGDRLGVTGGSYGGFMTNWIIGHTARFKAAASLRSISSWISFNNTSDIGNTFTESYFGNNTWTDSQLLWDRSPLKYADKVVTPTLFLHSDQDYRCWLVEGVQMYYALQHFEIPTRLVIFNNENHELSRSGKPSNRIKRLEEITKWFDKYL